MTERDQVIEILKKAISPPFKAVMGRGDGVVVVDGRPGYIWCRKLGKTEMLMEAYNRGAPDIEDVIVLVQESRIEGVKGYEVIGVASSTSPDNYYPEVPPHAWTHEYRPGLGRDRVTVYPRAWGYLRAEPIATGSISVWVTPGWYYYDDLIRWYAGGYSPGFTGTINQLLYFDPSDESLHIEGITGTMYGITPPFIPAPPDCNYPIAMIEVTGTFPSITENMIEDVRLFMDPIEDCGETGTGGVAAHNILDNSVHLDSALDAVTRGSLIVGNTEPEWDELDVGVTGTVLTTDGIDVFWAPPSGGVAAHNILDGDVHLDSAVDAVTRGSIIVGDSTPEWDELVIGSSGTVLASNGLDPFWAAMPGGALGVSYCNIQWHVDGPLQTGTEIGEARLAPPGFDMLGAWMYCKNPGSAGTTTVDINKNDVTIFTAQANRPALPWNDPDNKIKGGALAVTTLVEGDKLSMDIDGVATGVEDLDVLLILGATGTGPAGLIEIQEDDAKVTDASIVNFEGGGGKVTDEGGGKVTVDITPGGGGATEDQYGNNLVKNSPGQIPVDGAEPQWWDDTTDATITDEDTVGEGIPDKHERCFKVVTTANNEEGYQVLTFADEELLDAGQTVVSFGCWVYCVSANKASIAIMGANLGLQESAQHSGGASWEWLTVENITLNAADASISLYLTVDTGTAYYTMPMLCVNGTALPWKARGIKHVVKGGDVRQYDQNNVGDIAWSDTDCTANSDALAVGIDVTTWIHEPNGTIGSEHYVGPSDVVAGADYFAIYSRMQVLNNAMAAGRAYIFCDDSQVIRYSVAEQDADSDIRVILWINGYWMWE